MRTSDHVHVSAGSAAGRIVAVFGLLLVTSLLIASSASAAGYEQVLAPEFGSGSPNPLNASTSMAVNTTGAGSVPAGTVYVVTQNSGGDGYLVRYSGKGVFIDKRKIGDTETDKLLPVGVAVNQVTGDVYVYFIREAAVQVFHPDGSGPFEQFGERASFSETIPQSPSKLHANISSTRGIAVDDSGTVYLADLGYPNSSEAGEGGQMSRVMAFTPQGPGEDENYVYAGQGNDIAVSRSNDAVTYFPVYLGLDAQDHLFTGNEFDIFEFDLGAPAAPVCEATSAVGGIQSMTVDPEGGEVFYVNYKAGGKGHQLICNETSGLLEQVAEFSITPAPTSLVSIEALTFDPSFAYESVRPLGTLYAASSTGKGYIFVQPEVHPPLVKSQSVSQVTSTSAGLNALINPMGVQTGYVFEYLSEAAYQGNEPNEKQSLTVSASGGIFTVGFAGQQTGGTAKGTLVEGSETVEALVTAAGTGTFSAATGKGTLTAGSESVKSLSTTTGAFTLGQTISGTGIPSGTKIVAATASTLTLSKPATASGAAVSLKAGSTVVTELSTTTGQFVAGQPITGPGIPASTTVIATSPTSLTLSAPAEANGTGVALSSAGPLPFAVGQAITGPGIPVGTTIVAAASGSLTLSQPATENSAGASLIAGIPFNASADQLRLALDELSSIGGVGGSVEVTGGPGNETGSSPYTIVFGGSLENTDLPQLSSLASGLSGGSASAVVTVVHNGGTGFVGAHEAPLGGAPLGTGQSPLEASVTVSGLTPATGYRYRVTASSSAGTDSGSADSFLTFPLEVAGPPDGRAYELVSPAQKNGGEVYPTNPSVSSCGGECKPGAFLAHFTMQSSPDGDAVAYEGSAFSSTGAVQENEYVAKRTAAGWQNTFLSPALQRRGEQSGYRALSADLSRGLIKQGSPPVLSPEAPGEYANLYNQSTTAPAALQPLFHVAPLGSPLVSTFKVTYAGGSKDLSKVFFEANFALETSSGTPPENGGAEKNNIYEWSGGQLRLVNVNPDTTTSAGAGLGAPPPPPSESSLPLATLAHAVSNDGSRVFWTSESGEVFVRINGAETKKIEAPGKFLTASTDGSRVLLDQGCLYSIQAETCEDLTKDRGGVPRGGFKGVLGASDDLSRVYFIDTEPLTEPFEPNGNPKGPEHAEEGKLNLYVWHEGSIPRFIAVLKQRDNQGNLGIGDWAAPPIQRSAEASPNGKWLAFLSVGTPTGFDNTGPCELDHSVGGFISGPCTEVFLYDATGDKLVCPSCSHSGAHPLGPANLPLIVEGVDDAVPQPRYLTDAGRLYFNTQDSLSPFDTNGGGQAGFAVEDIYQYEPSSTGGCTQSAGCVSMISTGREAFDSNFLAMDSSGKNVFFTTRSRLVPSDKDELVDLYDAREGGGFPESNSPGECRGETCQPQPPVQSEPVPGSSGYEGPGNVKPTKGCKKGQVKKNGRCVKKPKHQKHKQHGKKSKSKRGGSK